MSQELITTNQQQVAPFGGRNLPGSVNAGAVSIEIERAIAEAQGQLIMAKRFPRDLVSANAELMDSCKILGMAEVAFYSIPQGGQKVTGPSIRLAEEIARVYGNFEYGHRELSRVEAGPGPKDFGRSEIEVYAWDKQTNNRTIRQITVLHVLDTKDGPRKLRDQKDIDNKIANVASKQTRGRILQMMPKWMVEGAIAECRKTLAGENTESVAAKIRKLASAFATLGVTQDHLSKYLGHPLDETLPEEIADLRGVYAAITDGTAASEFFGAEEDQSAAKAGASLAETAKAGAATSAATTGKPEPKKAAVKAAAKSEVKAEAAKVVETKVEEAKADPVADTVADPVIEDSNSDENDSNVAEEADPEVTDTAAVVTDDPKNKADIF
jgi:hypothetical protein